MKDELSSKQNIIKGWSFQNLLLEFYRYAPAPREWEPEHYHDEYQFCLSVDCPGEYYYRGTHYWVPTASISIIHPGEIHKGRDIDNRQIPATFALMYVSPSVLASAVTDITGRNAVPFFAEPIIINAELAQQFQDFHTASRSAVLLEQETAPGGVDTPMLQYSMKRMGVTPEQATAGVPIRRINTVEEMARAVMFLSSDDASSFAGSNVDVTGGMLD